MPGRFVSSVAEWGETFPAIQRGRTEKEGSHGREALQVSLRELLVAKICGTEARHDSGEAVEVAHRVVPRVEGIPEGIGGARQDILSGLILPARHAHLRAFRSLVDSTLRVLTCSCSTRDQEFAANSAAKHR